MTRKRRSNVVLAFLAGLCFMLLSTSVIAQAYLDNETMYSNQDPNTETRRSDHFRVCFGHYNWDGAGMTEAMAQGNLQMFEQMWNRWVNELGLHDINESATKPDGNKYRTNFNFLMTWNDGGGGGAWSSMDGNGFFYAMANPGYCRYDPPSGATPHEMGHAWEGSCGGFNGSDSSGAWWECTANWMQLQLLNAYPQAGGVLANSMYYPAHGRDYYDTWIIYEAAREDPRYGAEWVNRLWCDANDDQKAHEYILDRMVRIDASGSADKAGGMRDLWGDMAKKCVTWDYERQRWLAQVNTPWDGEMWGWYQRNRTPLVKMAGGGNWYRPERSHVPMEYGFNIIPLSADPATTVTCDFKPSCDPVRQSDWRACLVAVNNNGEARYSSLWNDGANSMKLGLDETSLYLVVIATPKPMKITDPVWAAYLSDAGLQFPYAVGLTNATPKNVVFTKPGGVTWKIHVNPDGSPSGAVASTATVSATAYVGPNALVLDNAKVLGNARIEDYAVVRGSAQVRDNAVISGHGIVQDSAQVYGNATVRDWGRVFGAVEIYDNAKVIEHGNCGDGTPETHTKVYGNAVVKGTTYVYNTSTLAGCLIMDGDSANGNGTTPSDHGVHFGWGWGADTARFGSLPDNGYIYAQHTFEKDNAAFAMDQYGINHGILMNGCRSEVDTVAPTRGGRVLPLNGVDQYVELHNSVNDFKETAISVWVKWTGTGLDQRIWSMGDGDKNYMYLTPMDATTNKLRLVINTISGRKDNSTTYITNYLDGASSIPANTWTHIAVTFTGSATIGNTAAPYATATATLYVNGAQVASASGVPTPDQLNAANMENANYLGRGNAGNYFQGYIDDFRVYMRGLSSSDIAAIYSAAAPAPITVTNDVTAPTPNASTWLVAPTAISDNAVTMSATPGTDASGWVEYYFTCTSGSGHDSGWVSFNKYTDVGLTPGTAYTYTVKMRDRAGNTTTASSPMSVTTQTSTVPQASFSYGPIGISSSAIRMTATKVASASGLMEYQFSRSGKSSGWQSSPTWTDTGLTSGTTYTYTVQMRDGRGNLGAASTAVSAIAADKAAPKLPIAVAEWSMQPYATLENKVCMTATSTEESGVQFLYECINGDGPDSGWISPITEDQGKTYFVKWTSSNPVADGTYTYRYKMKDAAGNISISTTSYSVTVKPTTGYHSYTMQQLATLPDDYLVSFNGVVTDVRSDRYIVKDMTSGASIVVKTSAYAQATDISNLFKKVVVNGHLYTQSGTRVVTFATVTPTGNAANYSISGKVINSTGHGIGGATVYFSGVPNAQANPVCTATTDGYGNYVRPVTSGTWYVAVSAPDYYPAPDRTVVVSGFNASNVNFTLATMPKISGKVTDTSGAPIEGATVFFSKVADATNHGVYIVTTDASGNYSRGVDESTTWYVAANGPGYGPSADTVVAMQKADIPNTNFVLSLGGDGLKGEYFDNKDLTAPKVTRLDQKINFTWNGVAPDPSMGSTDYSVRWTGQIKPRYSETYTFYTHCDDGVRLWVNNKLLVDCWKDGGADNAGTITLTADKWYSIKMEYYQGGGGAYARLDWSSPSQAREVVPQSRLWSTALPEYTVSGKVTDLEGHPIANAAVVFSDVQNGPAVTFVSTDDTGNYSQILNDGTWYVYAGASGHLTSSIQPITINGASLTNVDFALEASVLTRNIPRTDDLLVGALTESFPTSGATGPWIAEYPSGLSMAAMGNRTVDIVDGVKWEKNVYSNGNGYTVGTFPVEIPVQGVTIVAAVKPDYLNVGGEPRGEIVDCFYSELFLAVGHNDGQVIVCYRGYHQIMTGYKIPNGQKTILSLVVQPGGNMVLYANGVQKWSLNTGVDYTKLKPAEHNRIYIGRGTDGWSTFGGDLGDVFLYKVALNDAERTQLEADLTAKFINTTKTYTISAPAADGGSITPSGFVTLSEGASQTFTITPWTGYTLADVKVDGESKGAITTYTFDNVTANHSISAVFNAPPVTVTGKVTDQASGAGIGGATVYFSTLPNPASNPTHTVVTDANGNYSVTVVPGTWHVVAAKAAYDTSADKAVVVAVGTSPIVNIALSLTPLVGSDVFYKLDETTGTTATDSSGNAKAGTLVNGPAWTAGKSGNALSFDGVNDYISVPNLGDSSAITIAGWVNLDTLGTDSTGSAILACDGSDAGDVQLLIQKATGKLQFILTGNSPADPLSNYAFTSADFGKWKHVAVVYNSTTKTVDFYINGVLNVSRSLTSARLAGLSNGIRIGGWSGGRYFDGKIDEFHIYGRALSAAEIGEIVRSSSAMKISDAKKIGNGEFVTLMDKIVTYAPRTSAGTRSTNYFYIEDTDRSAGLLVQDMQGQQDNLDENISVTVSGVMKTVGYTGQRYLEVSSIPVSITPNAVGALGMTIKSVQSDLATLGLLVRVVGKVVELSPDKDWFTMIDGYGVPTIVICETGIPMDGFAVGDTVVVTGAVGRDIIFGDAPEGLILPRSVVKL